MRVTAVRPRSRALAALAAAIIAAGVTIVSVRGESPLGLLPLFSAGVLFLVAGAVASGRRPDSPTGRLLVATGFAWLLAQTLLVIPNALTTMVGAALLPLGLAALAHLALAYPSGLQSQRERVIAALPYALVLFSVPVMEFGDCADCPRNVVGLDIDHGFGRLWYAALLIAAALTGVCLLVVLVRRWRRAGVAARRVLLPVVPGACVAIVVYVVALLSELGLPTGLGPRWALVALVLLGAAPIVFLGGLLRARLARAHVGQLVVELGELPPGGMLRDALARALGDPTVVLAYPVGEAGGYVDGNGRPVELPGGDGGGAVVTLIERAGTPVGALIHDAALRDDQAHVDAVCAAAGLALENERLHAEVLARLAEVRASRARIVEAADAARRRVERNLHDGAQQRLVNLSLVVGMARSRLGPGHDVEPMLSQASEEAAAAIRELRELARGLHPTILNEAGLVAAVESAAERSPVPVDLHASIEGALPTPVEAAAYYVVAESLANAGKHAHASSVQVCIEHHDGRLRVEVADDGIGGAALRPGSGLEGLADRLAALDGRLEVHSAPGSGTRVLAELPCG